ncbi:MAG: hypothetical protein U5Q44_03995 [Dehalococcoidia bacterium]|nr:hypothetical protein [Dehalococcoidia bacterium]
MIPSIEACLHATSLGVPVHVLDGRQPGALTGAGEGGTRILPGA